MGESNEPDTSLWNGISKDHQIRIRDSLAKEARAKVEKDLMEAVPSPAEINGFKNFLDDVETDCMAQAYIASNEADRAELKLKWSRRLSNPLIGLMGIGLIPFTYISFVLYGQTLHTAVIVVTAALATLVLGRTTKSRHRILSKTIEKARRTSREFVEVATNVKIARTVGMPKSRADMKATTTRLTDCLLYQNRDFAPRIPELHDVRDQMRHRITIESYDHEQEFDGRLQEARLGR